MGPHPSTALAFWVAPWIAALALGPLAMSIPLGLRRLGGGRGPSSPFPGPRIDKVLEYLLPLASCLRHSSISRSGGCVVASICFLLSSRPVLMPVGRNSHGDETGSVTPIPNSHGSRGFEGAQRRRQRGGMRGWRGGQCADRFRCPVLMPACSSPARGLIASLQRTWYSPVTDLFSSPASA